MPEAKKCQECGREIQFSISHEYPGLCHECATRKKQAKGKTARSADRSVSDASAGVDETEVTKGLEIDDAKLRLVMNRLSEEERFAAAVVAGLAAAIVGAVLWAVVTVATGWQAGYLAVAIGFLVGFTVQKVGKGLRKIFGIAGGIISGVGCAFGNLLSVCALVADRQGVSVFDVLEVLTPELAWDMMASTFHAMDLVLYGIAIWAGYQYSFRKISAEDIRNYSRGTSV